MDHNKSIIVSGLAQNETSNAHAKTNLQVKSPCQFMCAALFDSAKDTTNVAYPQQPELELRKWTSEKWSLRAIVARNVVIFDLDQRAFSSHTQLQLAATIFWNRSHGDPTKVRRGTAFIFHNLHRATTTATLTTQRPLRA